MKKILCLVLTAVLILAASPAAYATLPSDTSLLDIVYTASDGERVFTAENSITSNAHIYNGDVDKQVYIMSCAYDSSGSVSDISVTTQNCVHGYNTLSSETLSVEAGGKVRTLVLNTNFTPIQKRSAFSNEINCMEITSFSLKHNGNIYYGNINDKTNEIFINVPYYAIGEGESELSRPDLSNAEAIIEVSEGQAEKISGETDYEKGVKYLVKNSDGNIKAYTAYVIYTLKQYSSDFEDGVISGNVYGKNGSASLTTSGTSGTITAVSESNGKCIKIDKTTLDASLSFTADKGCTAEMATDYFMEFDFKINSISQGTDAMYWYMGEMHQIIPSKTANGYTLKYRHGLTGAIKEIPGISEFEFGTMYHLSYSFSQSDMKGQLYIDRKFVGTLEDIYGKITSAKLSPIISLTAFKDAKVSAEFDNISVTYTEIQPTGKPKLHIIGDSIVQTYLPNDINREGWGAFMEESFSENLFVKNHAMSGQASGMALYSGAPLRSDMAPIWPLLKYNIYEGDYVMIALGINDSNNNSTHNPYYCASATQGRDPGACRVLNVSSPCQTPVEHNRLLFKKHVGIMIDDILNAGATPILVSPFLYVNLINNTLDEYLMTDTIREIAAEDNRIVCLDLTSALKAELTPMGAQAAYEKYYIPGDQTHTTVKGAAFIAGKVRALLKESDCSLKNYLLPESTPNPEKEKLFTVTDSTGKHTYEGYVDAESNKIYVEQIVDIYSGSNGYPKFYDQRANEYASLQNATYKTTIGGSEQSGNISLDITTPASITIGNHTYSVVLERHVAGVVANFNGGYSFTTSDDSNKNLITINHLQHVPGTYGGSRYGSGNISAQSLASGKKITDVQDVYHEPYFNVNFTKDEGKLGRRDSCIRIIKKGNSSQYAPALHLYEGGSNWGKNGKLDVSFDIKYTDFSSGSIADIQLMGTNSTPLVYLSLFKVNDSQAAIGYISSDSGAIAEGGFSGYGKKIATINKGDWTNIRIVLDRDNDNTFIICVNDEVVFKTQYKYSSVSAVPLQFAGNVVRFGSYSSTNCTYYLDNIEMTCSQKSQ